MALALSVLFLGAAARSAAVVQVVSGSGQTAPAYAASTEPGYVTTFPAPLVVRVSGAPEVRAVRYRCASRNCRFAVSTQPDEVKRIDPQTYEVRLRHGSASLRPTLSSDGPGNFVVEVTPVTPRAAGAPREARFRLTSR